MFCPNCGNKIGVIGNFCDSCGHSLVKKQNDENLGEGDKKKKEAIDVLWEKSIEIIKAQGKKLEEYREFYSDVIEELVLRLSINSFNELVEQFKVDFDKQPYKAVENIKHVIQGLILNAYDVHLAKKLLENGEIKKIKINDPEILVEEWKQVNLNFTSRIMVLPEEVAAVLASINSQISEKFFEDNPSLKELPNVAIETLKANFIHQLINGYLLGIAEDNIREQINKK
jgi:hypothetical protein